MHRASLRHLHALRKPSSNFPRIVADQPRFQPVVGRHFFFGSKKDDDDGEHKDSDNHDDDHSDSTTNTQHETRGRSKSQASTRMVSSSSPVAIGTGDNAPRPNPLLILPLSKKPYFPGTHQTLSIYHKPTIQAFNEMYEKDGKNFVGLFLRKDFEEGGNGGDDAGVITSPDEIYHTGTLAQFLPFPNQQNDENRLQVILTNHRRINFKKVIKTG
jgi:hypothetical protein